MTKIQFGLGVIVVGGLAATLAVQYQTRSKLGGENQALRQQVASLGTDNENLFNRLAQTGPPPSLADDQFRELLRLRGEVGRLRQQTNLLGKLQEENRRLQLSVMGSAKDQETEAARFVGRGATLVNAAKIIGAVIRIYANDNDNQHPTNFAQIHNELGNNTNYLASFEMMNEGKVNDKFPGAIEAREQAPRPSPLGGWERVYLLADGSVQVASSPNGSFDAWERDNTQPIPAPGQ